MLKIATKVWFCQNYIINFINIYCEKALC